MIPRFQLFEWEDFDWFPAVLRDLMTDYLRFVVGIFGMYKPVVPILADLLKSSGQSQVVDLASGGGGPWIPLATELSKLDPNLKVTLTDKYPNVKALNYVKQQVDGVIAVEESSVDALDVPAELSGLRTQFLSLHHFAPDQATALLRNAVDANQPIAIFEFQQRDISHVVQFTFAPILVLLLSWAIRPFSFKRLFFTYVIPLVPLGVMWDGVVSALRTYTVGEAEDMVADADPNDKFVWHVQAKKEGPITVFSLVGQPRTTNP